MRIVGGEWRGRAIKAPAGSAVRPTLDRVREAWMSIVQLSLPGARVLDLFAGTGALGIEALSRGAVTAEFVDSDSRSLAVLRCNLDALGATDRATVTRADALEFVETLPQDAFDVVFADPPYATDACVRLAERWLRSPFSTSIGIEHSRSVAMPVGGDTRRYGDSGITFYR
ncbi:MAG: 16S rRNA (guanine(966)-N(2))-methyltransferase RsmD [Gemmatimonadaceae bacterium]